MIEFLLVEDFPIPYHEPGSKSMSFYAKYISVKQLLMIEPAMKV